MRKRASEYVSVRAAAARMRKAPTTVRLMLELGEAEGTVIATEAGHARQYVSVAWLERWEQTQGAAPDAA
jgi:hypothetical protein